jgi:hypothetical protein
MKTWTSVVWALALAIVLTFTPREALASSPTCPLSGHVFFDYNADATWQPDAEPPLASVLLRLYHSDGDDQFEPDTDDHFLASAITASDGTYVFRWLERHEYWLAVASDSLPGVVELTTANQPARLNFRRTTQLDFGYRGTCSAWGQVWNDLDGDGERAPSEPGLPDVPIHLYWDGAANDLRLTTTRTDAQGLFLFDGLLSGAYVLEEIDPTGFVSTSPADSRRRLRIECLEAGGVTDDQDFGDRLRPTAVRLSAFRAAAPPGLTRRWALVLIALVGLAVGMGHTEANPAEP